MRLTSAPIMIVPDRGQGYIVYCDASKDRLGCVLMHSGRVVVLDIVFALKIRRHYLYSEQFKVFSDHKSLKYIFIQWDLNMR